LRIWAEFWQPTWIDGTEVAFMDVDAAVERRLSAEFRPADPFFVAITGYESYSCDGQRLAVRAVASSAADSTTLVVLPTGSGKTAVAYVAALLGERRGSAVVIVPTVALALDQERAFRELLLRTGRRWRSEDFAYHSGLDESKKRAIRQRISSGEQKIVFAAPESVERSLASSLYQAAEYGLITALVIDEAHVVSEWGDEFRPEFQSVAGLRRGLLRAAAGSQSGTFRTLLLTATPTQDSIETLRVAFADPSRDFGVVGSPALRLEPTYWAHEFRDEDARVGAVVDAVRHVPRPALLYTTKRSDADRWESRLRAEGFRRLAVVTGETPADRRREVLDGWRGTPVPGRSTRTTRYDVVIATSAFGLGVDQGDVRAVIHACIPETIDRFYQEVGRGGRDGRASLSLVLHCRGDRRVAQSVNQTKLITREKAEPRLRAMLGNAESLGQGRWEVDLAALPPQTPHKRSYNLQWNQRTINLLARAGAVEWEGQPPKFAESSDDEFADPEAWGAVIRLLRADHTSAAFWTEVEETRARRLASDTASLGRMNAALAASACVHRLLRDAYAATVDGGVELEPAESCGGCPWCRQHGMRFLAGGTAPVSTVRSAVELSGHLAWLIRAPRAGVVVYRETDSTWRSKVADAVRHAVGMGAIGVVLDGEVDEIEVGRLQNSSDCGAVFVEASSELDLRDLSGVPTVFLVGPDRQHHVTKELLQGGYLLPRHRLIIVPETARDPSKADRLLRDVQPHEPIESFLANS
jgi:superfamily II DNA helicase RecQ